MQAYEAGAGIVDFQQILEIDMNRVKNQIGRYEQNVRDAVETVKEKGKDLIKKVNVPHYWREKLWTYSFKCEWNCAIVLSTFSLLWLFHLYIMIFPLNFWCGKNVLLFLYSNYVFVQFMISLGWAINAPLITDLHYSVRSIPGWIGVGTSALWIIQCITELIKLLINGDLFKELDDIVGAYLAVLGIPHAVFTIYNFVRSEWWQWYQAKYGDRDRAKYMPAPIEGCNEEDYACWDRNGMSCYGEYCDDQGNYHGECTSPGFCPASFYKPANYRSHKPLPHGHTNWCTQAGSSDLVWCGPMQNLPIYGDVPKYTDYNVPDPIKPPVNLDGTPVDPNLYDPTNNNPKYTYDYPEQWNAKNPLFPLPPYPGRPPKPTQAELDAAAAAYGPSANVQSQQQPPIVIIEGYLTDTTKPYAF